MESSASPEERSPCEVGHPERERGRRERDHPRPSTLERREDGDEAETRREHDEEETDGAPMHAPIMPSGKLSQGKVRASSSASERM